MCQARPGPRCSAHMRASKQRTADAAVSAYAVYAVAVAAYTTAHEYNSANVESAQAVLAQTQQAAIAAQHEYRTAQNNYNATPEGMRALSRQAAYRIEQGDAKGAAIVEAQLLIARTVRADQIEALRVSVAHQHSAEHYTPAQVAKLNEFDSAANAYEVDYVRALNDVRDADRDVTEHDRTLAVSEKEHASLARKSAISRATAVQAQTAVQVEAERIYRAHGIGAGRSRELTTMMVEETIRGRTADSNERWRNRDRSIDPLSGPGLRMYSSERHLGTRGAAYASDDDTGFQKAKTEFLVALGDYRSTRQTVNYHSYRKVSEAHASLKRAAEQAHMRAEDSGQAAARARGAAHRAHAEIADLPKTTGYQYNAEVRAYTLPHDSPGLHNRPYEAPSPGLPNGRILPPLSTSATIRAA